MNNAEDDKIIPDRIDLVTPCIGTLRRTVPHSISFHQPHFLYQN